MSIKKVRLDLKNISPKQAGFLIFAGSLMLRMVYFAQSLENPLLYSLDLDEAYYAHLAELISGGSWWGEALPYYMDPLYGYILAGTFFLFGQDLLAIRLIQIVLDSASVLLIYGIGIKLGRQRAGLIAAVFYGIYTVAFFYTLLILKTTLTVFFLLTYVWLLLGLLESPVGGGRWIFLGSMAGFMTYLRANLVLAAPLTLLMVAVLERPRAKPFLWQATLFVVGFILLLAPGFIRNAWIGGDAAWLSTQSGRLLYSCNNPGNLTGVYDTPSFARSRPEESEADFRMEAQRRTGKEMKPSGVSEYWRAETLQFLRDHPQAVLQLVKNKLKWTFSSYEIPMNQSFYSAARFAPLLRWPLPDFALALALGIPGLCLGIASQRKTAWLCMPILIVFCTMMVFCVSSRFRLPAVPFLLIGAGISMDSAWTWLKSQEGFKVLLLCLAAVSLFVTSKAIPGPRPTGFEEFSLARAYWAIEEFETARTIASGARKRFPGDPRFPILLGSIALSQDNPAEAVRQNRSALRLDPDNAVAWHHLGAALLEIGQTEKAILFIRKSLLLRSEAKTWFDLGRAYERLGDEPKASRAYRKAMGLSKPLDPLKTEASRKLFEAKRD